VQIVDWYLVADCLKRVAQAAFPTGRERDAWLEAVTKAL